MKLQKESLWILLALIVSPFYFVYRETLEVKDGEVRAYKTLWWSRTTEVKSLKPSCVGEVYTKWGAVPFQLRCWTDKVGCFGYSAIRGLIASGVPVGM